jgi:thiol-disulfide isomerase/thioredoxin
MGLFSKRAKPAKIHSLDELKPMLESGKPILLDFMQLTCGPCKVMDGIVNELAEEYAGSAHVVKVDVTKVPGAAQAFGVRSTPTFVLLGTAPQKKSNKARRRAGAETDTERGNRIQPRWRTSGLVRKDQLQRVLESNGATPASG